MLLVDYKCCVASTRLDAKKKPNIALSTQIQPVSLHPVHIHNKPWRSPTHTNSSDSGCYFSEDIFLHIRISEINKPSTRKPFPIHDSNRLNISHQTNQGDSRYPARRQ